MSLTYRLVENKYLECFSNCVEQGLSETEAQKIAMKECIDLGVDCSDVLSAWKFVRLAHLKRLSNIEFELTLEQIKALVSASQSWNKSSGHAFELFVSEQLSGNVVFELQKSVTIGLKKGLYDNSQGQLDFVGSRIQSGSFDLYASFVSEGRKMIFGCIQAKTSIRDRIKGEREPSMRAMGEGFWSVVFVLDGGYMENQKFLAALNGGSDEYNEPGWHAMYSLSAGESVGRLFCGGFGLVSQHALAAYECFSRGEMSAEWTV